MTITLLIACSKNGGEDSTTIVDQLDRKIELKNAKISRVIGLSPGISEILAYALPDSTIVGRTKQCDYPPEILDKPEIESYPLDLEALVGLN